MTIAVDDDLFEAAEPDPDFGLVNRNSRYRYPAPPGWTGQRPRRTADNPYAAPTWMRATNLVSAFSDQERLQLWLERKTLLGLRVDDGVLFDEWMTERVEVMDEDTFRAVAKDYAERARAVAGTAGARRGTARHTMLETYFSTGEITGTRNMQRQLQATVAALEAADLEVIPDETERKVWHPAGGGCMGTRDARVLCRRTGQVGVLDWKTQARFWTFQEICGQLALYDEAPYTWEGPATAAGRWVPSEENTLLGHPDGEYAGRRVALVMHLPIAPAEDQAPATLYEVDIEYGHRVVALASQIVELRSIGKSVAVGRRPGAVRP